MVLQSEFNHFLNSYYSACLRSIIEHYIALGFVVIYVHCAKWESVIVNIKEFVSN